MNNIEVSFKKFCITFSIKVFLISFLVIFLSIILQHFGVRAPQIINPIQKQEVDVLNLIKSKLYNKPNTYKLTQDISFIPSSFAADQLPNASSYAVVDFDNGKILIEKLSQQKLSVASLTKIMTAVVALDLAKPNDMITITEKATRVQPTSIGVVRGEKMTLKELLNATLMTSANDAAEAIKDGIDSKYGNGTFVKAMNQKASFIGLKNTRFSNPQGFDSPNNFSTAQDLGVLSHYALTNYPLIAQIVKKDYQLLPQDQNHKQFDLYNWNGLIDVYPDTIGIKIGNTNDAGTTTVVLSARQNKKILVVLLGTPGVLERDLWTSQLLDIGYEQTLGLSPISVTEQQLKEKYSTWRYW